MVGKPTFYRIRVTGRLDLGWSEFLGGLAIEIHDGEGGEGTEVTTELTGPLADEAALMGVLEHLYSLRIPLLSVECLGKQGEEDDRSAE